ncbi:MAG TPA: phospholipase A [Cellvibrio sp.]|nr:phospholipase A [Cellvibrio sp.]
MWHFLLLAVLLLCSVSSYAESEITTYSKEEMLTCVEASVARADESMTVKQLQEACKLLLAQRKTKDSASQITDIKPAEPQAPAAGSDYPPIESTPVMVDKNNQDGNKPQRRLLQDRLTIEALNRSNRFVLTPNKRNFLLPISYSDTPNTEPYTRASSTPNSTTPNSNAFTDLNHTEAELQLSVKILLRENIFEDNGHLYLGYTNHALWQVYNRRISAPFRGTDHQPELILSFTNNMEIFGLHNVVNEIILNHQSNGQTGMLSRSWNRIMLNTVFEKDRFAFAFNPWYRLPEDKAEYPSDPRGDDNPDISKYMGHFQFSGAYKRRSDIFSIEIRNNLDSENRGAVELGWSFPVSKTMRGYFSYFDGYGHSLIDYNYHKQVIGLGIIFTDLF